MMDPLRARIIAKTHARGTRMLARYALRKDAPRPGDAIAVAPHFEDGEVRHADAGRLLSTDTTDLGHARGTYHSATSNSRATTPMEHVKRLEEPAGSNEGTPTTKIVPLKLGDPSRHVVVHEGKTVGTLSRGEAGGQEVHTVDGALGSEGRSFLDRNDAVKAILEHHGAASKKPEETPDPLDVFKARTLGDLFKAEATGCSLCGETVPGGRGTHNACRQKAWKKAERIAAERGITVEELLEEMKGTTAPAAEPVAKALTLGDLFEFEQRIVNARLEDLFKLKDATGHEHAADGKFGSGGSKKSDDSGDGGEPAKKKPHAVFLMGGAGTGKGALAAHYREQGIDNVINSDDIKETVPGFSNKADADGRYGPSGPVTHAQFRAYPQAYQDKVNAWIKNNTDFDDADDFSNRHVKVHRSGTTAEPFGGGLTHELSVHLALAHLKDALAKGESFVYDAVGSTHIPEWAEEALKKGMRVTAHHAIAPLPVKHMRNAERDRSIDEKHVNSTDHYATMAAAHAKHYAALAANDGKDVKYREHHTSDDLDLKAATAKGYTATGRNGPRSDSDLQAARDAGYSETRKPTPVAPSD